MQCPRQALRSLNLPLRPEQVTKYTAADLDEFDRRPKGKLTQGIRRG